MLDRIEEEVGRRAADDWNGRLRAWADACATGYLDVAGLHGMIFAVAPSPLRTGFTRNILIDHLADLLEAGNRNGAWTLADPSFTAVFLFNALHGVVTRDGAAGDEPERAALLRELDAHFRNVVRRPAGL